MLTDRRRLFSFCLAAVIVLFLVPLGAASAETISWKTDSSGDWTSAANWDLGRVPTAGDDVVIDRSGSPTVRLPAGDVTVASLRMTDSLTVQNAKLTVTGAYNISNAATLRVEGAAATFSAVGPAAIDNGRFTVLGGAQAEIAMATSYSTLGIGGSATIVSVDGAGSRLDLSSVTKLSVGPQDCCWQYFQATNGGVVDLSGLKEIANGAYAQLLSSGGGRIVLTALEKITGGRELYVELQGESNPMPQLREATNLYVVTRGVVELPLLETLAGSNTSIQINAGTKLKFPKLVSLLSPSVTIESGGELEVPLLTSFANKTLTLKGTGKFSCAPLTNIDNTRFFLSGGAVFDNISATTYSTRGLGSGTITSVTGAGTRLGLGSVRTLSTGTWVWPFGATQSIEVSSGGVIDLSGLTSHDLYSSNTSYTNLTATSGGRFLLDALTEVAGGGSLNLQMGEQSAALPNLVKATNLRLSIVSGQLLEVPMLREWMGDNNAITIASQGVLFLPLVQTLAGIGINITVGGTLHAPQLSQLTASALTLHGSARMLSLPLSNIDNLRFFMSGGARFNNIAATSYTLLGAGEGTVLSLADNGTELDLSSVRIFRAGAWKWPFGATQSFEVRTGARLIFGGLLKIETNESNTSHIALYSSGSARIEMPNLRQIDCYSCLISATGGGSFHASSLTELRFGAYNLTADGSDSVIDLRNLCSYENTTFSPSGGGQILHSGLPLDTYMKSAVYGTRAETTCSGANCSTTALMSYLADGRCLRDLGVIKVGTAAADVDAVAVSPAYGVVAYELVHNTSGAVTGSRMLKLDRRNGAATVTGSTLANREIRGATFVGDNLFVLDTLKNDLLQIAPHNGALLTAPWPLRLGGVPYDVTPAADIAVAQDGRAVLVDGNSGYQLNLLDGSLTLLHRDTQPLQDGILPGYSGAAFAAPPATTDFKLHVLSTAGIDQIFSYGFSTARTLFFDRLPASNILNAQFGDLGSVSTVDSGAPGSVTITIDPRGDGTTMEIDWSAYNEAANGNDIHHYTVFKSTSSFTDATTAAIVTSLPAGTKHYRATELTRGQRVYFAVAATDSSGNVNYTVTSLSNIPQDIVPPQEVTNLRVQTSNDTSLVMRWDAAASDTASFKLYRDGTNIASGLSSSTRTYTVGGLTLGAGYNIRVSALDSAGNESGGVAVLGATLLPKITGLATQGGDNQLLVTWSPFAQTNLVKAYRIYLRESLFTSVSGLTPKGEVTARETSFTISGLSNGRQYFVAVTAVNISNGENLQVTAVSGAAGRDREGPTLSEAKLGSIPLANGLKFADGGDVSVRALDVSGISAVTFAVSHGGTETQFGSAFGSGPLFSSRWDTASLAEGAYTLIVRGTDTPGNVSELRYDLTLDFAPPAPPQITSPASGVTVNQLTVDLHGMAERGAKVRVYRAGGGELVAGPILADSSSRFSASVTLVDGANIFTATAEGRGGVSAQGPPVTITVDRDIPPAPQLLTAQARASGEIALSWQPGSTDRTYRYHLYRSSQSFADAGSAQRVTIAPTTQTSFNDLPPQDGVYFYRVAALNNAALEGALSNEASSDSDRTPPSAIVTYQTTGLFDPPSSRFAPGVVTVALAVSEELQAPPFLSIAPQGGIPTALALQKKSALSYEGEFRISATTPSGRAWAVFSARDLVGNRGTEITSGESLLIDAEGPSAALIQITPPAPVQTSAEQPVSIGVTLTLTEAPKNGTSPALSYLLSGVGRTAVEISAVSTTDPSRLVWTGSFTLLADAGAAAPESLSFVFRAEDDLGNASVKILGANAFQVYQGNLPPLAPPAGLSAKALSGGRVLLKWLEVKDAAAYRIFRGASGREIEMLDGETAALEFTDSTPRDGVYEYAVASVRRVDTREAISAPSSHVTVTADSVPPPAPEALALQLTPQGIRATWQQSATADGATFSLYRADLGPGEALEIAGRAAVRRNITVLETLDPSPSPVEHAYAVTALDEAGNESPPSNTEYLNFSLLPVTNLKLTRRGIEPPVLTWSKGQAAATRIEIASPEQRVLYEGAQEQFIDSSYLEGERSYVLTALDAERVESLARSITLPAAQAALQTQTISRGIFNRLVYRVTNTGQTAFSRLRLKGVLRGRTNVSEEFDLAAYETREVALVIGGEFDLGGVETLTTLVTLEPNAGEAVELTSESELSVGDSALLFSLDTEEMVRGAQGRVRFTFTNTSDVTTEIVTARGGASPEVRFKLLDRDGNVLSVMPVTIEAGEGVLTVPSGETVARVLPGASFSSPLLAIDIPSGAPLAARLALEIASFHFASGTPQHAAIRGHGTERDVALAQTEYYGEVTSVNPAVSFGDEPIRILGRGVMRGSGEGAGARALDLVLKQRGFERKFRVQTAADGAFEYLFVPAPSDSGVFQLSALYPNALDRPVHAEFTIGRVTAAPTQFNVHTPRNYETPFTVELRAAAAVANVRLEYRAEDQEDLTLAKGVRVVLPAGVSLAAQETKQAQVVLSGDKTAADAGTLRLRLMSDAAGARVLGTVRVHYRFSSAAPSLMFSPSWLETGVDRGSSVNETVAVENRGLAPLVDASFALFVEGTEQQAPRWLYSTTPPRIERLEVGERLQLELVASPDAGVREGYHHFTLRMTAAGEASRELPIVVAVTQQGRGSVLFHLSDIYTATLDGGGRLIPGLAGARVKLQHEQLLGIERAGESDAAGELLFDDLPAGEYLVRASASDHQDLFTRVRVRPGVTAAEELFLVNSVVNVEWSVREITIEDRYEIVLTATYETNVPLPVLVFEPVGTQLPNLKKGEVFYGELALTNYGLIEARDLAHSFPASDERARYEFFNEVPRTLGPKDRVIIPYRITALADFSPAADGEATGGGSCQYSQSACVGGKAICANGKEAAVSACTYWVNTRNCPTSGSGGPAGPVTVIGGGGGGSSPGTTTLMKTGCMPGRKCNRSTGSVTD